MVNFRELDSLLGTLSRILKDDYKKSTELCLYVLSLFYMLSYYPSISSISDSVSSWGFYYENHRVSKSEIRFKVRRVYGKL